MRLLLLSTLPSPHTRAWMHDGLVAGGHEVVLVDRPGLDGGRAGPLGHAVASMRPDHPDVVLALGWVAGVAAQVATRDRPTPVVLRLDRPGRSGDADITRIERALARSCSMVLAAGGSDAEMLARLGVPRANVAVLPEAVDTSAYAEPHRPPETVGQDVVVAADDTSDYVHAVLSGMAAGHPSVVADVGLLSDIVADGVTGVVAPAGADLDQMAHALRQDRLRVEEMGLAANDRALVTFDVNAVLPRLERFLGDVAAHELATA